MHDVITEIEKYITNFLEKPHEIFSNLPICPFVKEARLHHKIDYRIQILKDTKSMSEIIETFIDDKTKEVLFFVSPKIDSINEIEIEEITDQLTMKFYPNLQMFAFHPKSNFEMNGIYTRRTVYPGIIVQRDAEVYVKETKLRKTHYYDKLTRPMCDRTSKDECFYVSDCGKKGKGLFAKKSWKKGEDLFKLSGKMLSLDDASNFAIQISETEMIDSFPEFNDYILNHSCDPNCKVVFKNQLTMQAAKDITIGEELTWDYETTEENMIKFGCNFECHCGSNKCRQQIRGYAFCGRLPAWFRERLSR
jgi:SET domain